MQTITTSEWLVLLGGLAAIALVNWYFFANHSGAVQAVAGPAGAGSADGTNTNAPAQVTITVDGGYSPAQVRVKAGQPLRLVFDRRDNSSCSEEVVLPDFGIRKFLPTGQQTTIEITPATAGRYEFMCGMSMLRGTIIAED
ncbi:MAG: cupredoxin domain-containing protein [Gemmatimonadaceae bacterium]